MKINLNNALVIGTIAEKQGNNGHCGFTRYAITKSQKDFLSFCQYLIDGCPDVSAFVIVDVESQIVIRFDSFVFDTLKMKSKRYSH